MDNMHVDTFFRENQSQHPVKEIQAEIDEFKRKNARMLHNLEALDWTMSEDPLEAEFSMECFKLFATELPAFQEAVERSATIVASQWVDQHVSWEVGMQEDQRRQQRKELLAVALSKGAPPEAVLDAQRRWETQEFTSVSNEFLVIGDFFVRRRGGQLSYKNEVDPDLPEARSGRRDLTYQMWAGGSFLQHVEGIRPKINGERFVRMKEGDEMYLQGFKRWKVPLKFRPTLVEYYAGQYYVLAPPTTQSQTYDIIDERGHKFEIEFLPHPWMSSSMYWSQKERFQNHKYDGVMFFWKNEEIRAKWQPSTEVVNANEVWEVSFEPKIRLLRPRPGKAPMQIGAAQAVVRSRIRAKFVIPSLLGAKIEKAQELQIAETATLPDVPRLGAKILFFVPRQGQRGGWVYHLLMIREKGKPLDLIGGNLKLGESHIVALLREIFEETGVRMAEDQLVYLGISSDYDKSQLWTSHVYLAQAPPEILLKKEVELYEVATFEDFRKSDQGYPRQRWLDRHLLLANNMFVSLQEAYQYYVMAVRARMRFDIPINMMQISQKLWSVVEADYREKLFVMAEDLVRGKLALSHEEALIQLATFWYIPKKEKREGEKISHGEELVRIMAMGDVVGSVALYRRIASDQQCVKGMTPTCLKSVLRSWGYVGSEKKIKIHTQWLIQQGLLDAVIDGSVQGGLVYRLKE